MNIYWETVFNGTVLDSEKNRAHRNLEYLDGENIVGLW